MQYRSRLPITLSVCCLLTIIAFLSAGGCKQDKNDHLTSSTKTGDDTSKETDLSQEDQLIQAIQDDHFNTVSELIKDGVNVNVKHEDNRTAFQLYIWRVRPDNPDHIIKQFIKAGVDINSLDDSGFTALDYYIQAARHCSFRSHYPWHSSWQPCEPRARWQLTP